MPKRITLEELAASFHPFASSDFVNPDFEHTNKVHDWRNHIPEGVRDVWQELPLAARLAAAIVAEAAADAEHWE